MVVCSDENVRVSVIVYYKEIKRELKRITEGSTRLTYTGLCPLCERNEGGLCLEHLKIETGLIDERFASVMCFLFIITENTRSKEKK